MSTGDSEKTLTDFIIQRFAIVSAIVAALLPQTFVGDEVILIGLTTAMIIWIAKIHKKELNVMSMIKATAGWYFGIRLAILPITWIPIFGNIVNAIATFKLTQFIGWTAYKLMNEDQMSQGSAVDEK